MSLRFLVLSLVAMVVALGSVDAQAQNVRTPGYEGTRKAPRTKPVTPTPPPVKAGEGTEPSVLVDAGGTAHVVWVEYFTSVPALRYCRIKRGARACDPTAGALPRPDGAEFDAFVVAYGDALVLISQRPVDGAGPVYAYVSEDGGTSFHPPVLIGGSFRPGDPANANLEGAVTFGTPGNEQIGLVYSSGYFQAVRPGVLPGGFTALVPQSETFGVDENAAAIAASAGGGVSVAYAGRSNDTIVRAWNGGGDPSDPAQWSPRAVVSGFAPRMSGGPGGAHLLTTGRTAGDMREKLLLHKLARNGKPGRPVVLARDPFGPSAAISPQAAGDTVRVVWLDRAGVLRTRTAAGARLGRPSIVHTRRRGEPIGGARSAVATAADGGGFLAYKRNSKDLFVSAFGTQLPTGRPGLGGLPGGGPNLEPGVLETCSRIEFSALDVVAGGGCLLNAVGKPGTKVAEGLLKLNGLEIVPDRGVKILLNSRAKTFDTTGKVTVRLRLGPDTVIPLLHAELHLKLPSEADKTQAAPGCTGTKLMGFDADLSKPVLKGFPIQGQVAVFLGEDSACIPVALGLPKAFGGVRGSAVLRTTNKDGLLLDSMKISVQGLYLGPLLVERLGIEYKQIGNQWDGAATIGLPPQPGGVKLGGSVRFVDGAFRGATFTVSPPFPGLALIGPTFLRSIGGGFQLDPFQLQAQATVGALPLPGGIYAVSVDGKLVITFGDPVVFDFTGEGSLVGFGVAKARVTVTTNGFFRAEGSLGADLHLASIQGGVAVFVDLPSKTFSGRVRGDVCILRVCLNGQAVVSSVGMGGCIEPPLPALPLGFAYRWGDSPLQTRAWIGSCDLSDYEVPVPASAPRARAAQAGAPVFSVPAGAPVASIRLTGQGGPPTVALVAPDGRRIVPSADPTTPAPAYAVADAATQSTYVAVPKPAAGTWTVETVAGSAPIAQLLQARPLAPPRVRAGLGGRGRTRTLTYRARSTGGLRTTFVETDARGRSRIIGRATKSSGKIRFGTGPGAKGVRTVTARTDRNGIPRAETKVGTYTAPPPLRPGRPGKVRVVRRGGGLVVRFGRARRAAGYTVTARLSDGRTPFFAVGRKRRRVLIQAVPRDVGATVTVVARDRTGRAGPKASGRTRKSNKRGRS